jgi:PAS domain S-box-containing protein
MNPHSLSLRLPVLMSALIAAVLGTFLWVAYLEVDGALAKAGAARAQGVVDQLSGLLATQQQQRQAAMQRVARSEAVVSFMAQRANADAARERIAALTAAGQPPVEIWDNSGQRLLSVPGPPAKPTAGATTPAPTPELPPAPAPSRPGLSDFQLASGVVFWDNAVEITTETHEEGEPQAETATTRLGFIAARAYLSPNSSPDAVNKLLGAGALLKIGNQSGTVWSDLAKPVDPPPADMARAGVSEFTSASGERWLGANALIRGTPWAVWVEFPTAVFVAPARLFLARMLTIALGFVAVSAVCAWVLSRRMTNPLQHLTQAAEAIAAGRADEPVSIARRDEIGRLAAAFSTMASQVRATQRELEDRVAQRTASLAETAAQLEQHVAQLSESRTEIDRFFSVSLDMLCIADLEGRFKRVNPAWTATLGWSAEELCGRPYLDFVHPDDQDATVRESGKLADGAATTTFQNRYACRDGSYRWLEWKAAPAVDRGVIFAAARDVTEHKAAESNIRALNQQLEQRVAQLNALTTELESFSYSVSHDLRAPLRHVTGFAQLLETSAGAALDERGRRYLKTITDSANRMGRLIDDLLVFSRMGRSEMMATPVDLGALVEEVRKEATAAAPDRRIEWKIHDLPVVNGDPAMLRLVVANLISNAVKYSATRDTSRIEIGCNGSPQEAVFYVRDNGVGFDMQYAHKLFGVFQRLHSSDDFEGTGIGLANVRRIIQRHGGRVWADSAVDAGATFSVSLPQTGGAR